MTSPGPPVPPPDAGLDAEERAMAARLSRLGTTAGPPAAVDARIRTAARAAMRPPARARWPLLAGLAASVALVAVVAWRMQSLPQAGDSPAQLPKPTPTPAASPEAARAPAPADADATPATQARPTSPARRGPPAPTEPEPADAAGPGAAAGRPTPPPGAAPPPPSSPGQVPVPAAPPPAVTDAPAIGPEAEARLRGQAPAPNAAAEAEAASAAQRLPRGAADDASGFEHAQLDEEPPVSADAPQVQQAWLQRIRELMLADQAAEARDSLAEFRRRYPAQPIPDDLRSLEE